MQISVKNWGYSLAKNAGFIYNKDENHGNEVHEKKRGQNWRDTKEQNIEVYEVFPTAAA